jgi:uncharacterized membrane protein
MILTDNAWRPRVVCSFWPPLLEIRTWQLMSKPSPTPTIDAPSSRSFRRGVLRGLGIVLPPLLTVVILLWIFSTLRINVLQPLSDVARDQIAHWLAERVPEGLSGERATAENGRQYVRLASGDYVPVQVHQVVSEDPNSIGLPSNRRAYYHRFVELRYLRPQVIWPLGLVVLAALMYLLGSLLAAGVGRALWAFFERGLLRLPVVRNVYGSVKKVTDFMLNENQVRYSRVVAVEYPRRGIWTLGLVTGDVPAELAAATGEPMVALLLATSPMPVTGYTLMVRQSDVLDLDVSLDETFQYLMSCGVIVPPRQRADSPLSTAPPANKTS